MGVKTSEDKARIHKLSVEQIDVEVGQLRSRLFELRTQAVTEKIEDPSQFRKTRREIARLMTERSARRNQEAGSN
jgi:large subunit ribosomal protein L29